jgi:ribosomal protein S27E
MNSVAWNFSAEMMRKFFLKVKPLFCGKKRLRFRRPDAIVIRCQKLCLELELLCERRAFG